RIRAVLRRTVVANADSILEVGALRIDRRSRRAWLDSREIDLAVKEFDVLAYLAERRDVVVGKRELVTEIWHRPYNPTDRTVDVHLSWLRRKLGESAREPR